MTLYHISSCIFYIFKLPGRATRFPCWEQGNRCSIKPVSFKVISLKAESSETAKQGELGSFPLFQVHETLLWAWRNGDTKHTTRKCWLSSVPILSAICAFFLCFRTTTKNPETLPTQISWSNAGSSFLQFPKILQAFFLLARPTYSTYHFL